MYMEDRLRKFAALLDAGGFTRAARELHISQPALSVSIAKLERELNTPLYVRGSRPVAATPGGKLAYAAAKKLAANTDDLQLRLAELAQADIALSVGMIDSLASTLFTPGNGLPAAISGGRTSLVVDNSRNLLAAVERGEQDMAVLVARTSSVPADITLTPLADEPFVLVCHAAQRTALRAALRHGSLPNFISYDRPSATSQVIYEALHRRGIEPKPTFYSTSPEVMLNLVRVQQGVAALPYGMVRPFQAAGEIYLLGEPEPWVLARRIAVAHRRDRTLTASLTDITRQLVRLLEDLSADAARTRNTVRA